MQGSRHAGDSGALLTEALHLSEALLAAANAGRWEEVRALCPTRDSAVRAALDNASGDHPDAVDTPRLVRLAALDREIVAAAEVERDTSRARIEVARRAGKVRKAYATSP